MCGIVGYLGDKNPQDIIISGLKKLEYRGYDSAGIALIDQNKTQRLRAEGKLKFLEEKLAKTPLKGHIGIGHTRWATHGAPSEKNAHPHYVNGVSIVHNGIIENYQDIRESLVKEGAEILSDTDSELVAHLIAKEVATTKDLLSAVKNVLGKLKGAFSILAIWDQMPNQMVAFKDGPPLVIGHGNNEFFVASDVQALLQYTKKFVYLEDREIAFITNNTVKYFNSTGSVLLKTPVEINWDSEMVEKQGYSHFMLKEIYEQPRAISSAIRPHLNLDTFTTKLFKVGFGSPPHALENLDANSDWENTKKILSKIERIIIVACGTSYYAGLYGKYLIENIGKVPVDVDIASEFRYRNPIIPKNTLLVSISQSGETADTLAAVRMAKEAGALTLSICNVKNSSIDRESSGHLYMNSGPEIGVASTKAFTSTLSLLACFATAIGRITNSLSAAGEKELVQALLACPSQVEVALAYDKYFSEAADKLKTFKGFLYLGRGVNYPVALEGALKLKELAYLHAEGYAAGEMKHGPLALIDSQMGIVTIAPDDSLYEKTVSNLEEARARGGKIIAIGTEDNTRLKNLSEYYLSIGKTHWIINPIVATVPLQLMAFHLACKLGHDVDQPRNLAKSVTVE